MGSTDWTEVTAWATIALATVTFLLVVAAVFAAWYARRDIQTHLETSAAELSANQEATRSAQATAQQQIEASYRPLLIDVSEYTSKPSDLDPLGEVELHFTGGPGHDARIDWRKVYVAFIDSPPRVCVAVPLRNVGAGPAIIEPHGIQVVGEDILPQRLGCNVHRERVPPHETTRILCVHDRELDASPASLDLRVPYADFAAGQHTFADVRLERLAEERWRVQSIRTVPASGST